MAFTIIALRPVRIVTLPIIYAAHTIGSHLLHDTKWCKLKAPIIRLGITHGASAIDADPVKAIALIIVEAGYAADAAVLGLYTKWGIALATGIVGHVTDEALIAHALAQSLVATLFIVDTGHTFIALISGNTDTKGILTAIIATDFAGFTDIEDTLVETRLLAIVIGEARYAIDPTSTERRIATTTGIIGPIAQAADAVDTLAGPRLTAVIIA